MLCVFAASRFLGLQAVAFFDLFRAGDTAINNGFSTLSHGAVLLPVARAITACCVDVLSLRFCVNPVLPDARPYH